MKKITSIIIGLLLCCNFIIAQDALQIFQSYLQEEKEKHGLTTEDINNILVSSNYTSKRSGVTHIYLDQAYNDIPVFNAKANANILKDGSILSAHINFVADLKNKISNSTASLSAETAAIKVAQSLGHTINTLTIKENKKDKRQTTIFQKESIALEDIKVSLIYFANDEEVRLTWAVEFYELGAQHNWYILVDASTGAFLFKKDLVAHCHFGTPTRANVDECDADENRKIHHEHHSEVHTHAAENLLGSYSVFALPTESPTHGPQSIVSDPHDVVASPWGWHDINGDGLADYTITRGNNVHAFLDVDSNDTSVGDEPDGGAGLNFNFPFDPNGSISDNQDAGVVNLFYICNMMHDIWYRYGFDEAAGCYQQNNFENGGLDEDYIIAQGLDTVNTNYASFSTGPDGDPGRIRMSLWTSDSDPDRDTDFDNTIICHEYGHGITRRLIGGPNDHTCMFNAEIMNEGWSDWHGLILTIEEGDTRTDPRGFATYAINDSITGAGLRGVPYTTDFTLNPYTYADTNNPGINSPHGIGFIWATALWEMTWDLIDEYGYDSNLHTGTGGNNIAMTLVIEALKMVNCSPGFIDGRNAILDADEAIYGGQNQCIIWEAFARRGYGYNASQGSSDNRYDQIEAFDALPACLNPVTPPTAGFTSDVTSTCSGEVNFPNTSTNMPQTWLWDFGDGNTSTDYSPMHTFTISGTYVVNLTVTNTLGEDNHELIIEVDLLENPVFESVDPVCKGNTITLSASGEGEIDWFVFGEYIHTGDTYTTPPLFSSFNCQIMSSIKGDIQFGGPEDGSFAGGGYHNTGFTGASIFEAYAPFTLISAWVDAGDAGDRLIELYNWFGEPISSVTVFIPEGQSRVTLNLEIPGPGIYSVGGTEINLFRNNEGANYPYQVGDVATITSSTATNGELEYFYYLYDWEVQEFFCESDLIPLSVGVVDSTAANFTFDDNGLIIDFTDNSVNATSWSWDFGDGTTSTEQNPIHEYDGLEIYTVSLTVSNGSCESTFTEIIDLTTSTYNLPNVKSLALLPNIGTGQFILQMELVEAEEISINIFNTIGKKVYSETIGEFARINHFIDLDDLAAGAYIIQIQVGKQSTYRRYVLAVIK